MIRKMIPCIIASTGFACAALTGYVKLPDGTAVSGVQIEQVSTQKTTLTDAQGFFNFDNATQIYVPKSDAFGITIAENSLQLFIEKGSLVSFNLFSMQGHRLEGFSKEFSAGNHEISMGSNLASGIYMARITVGKDTKSFKILKNTDGVGACTAINSGKSSSLFKELAVADTLKVKFENQDVGSVAIYNDDIKIDDIVISHKVISGTTDDAAVSVSLKSSEGDEEKLSANVIGNAYSATSSWSFYKAFRTWDITAGSKTESGVKDATQNITINLSNAAVELKETSFTYNASLDFNSSDYSTVTVDLGASQVAAALGIATSELSGVTYYAVSNGSLDSNSTAEAPGHWFDENGVVTNYNSGTPMVFSQFNLSAMTTDVGQYPNKLTIGKTYTVKQAVRKDNSIVYFTINLTITGTAVASSSSVTPVSSSAVSSSSTVTSSASTSSSVIYTYTIDDMYNEPAKLYKFVDWVWSNRLAANKLDQIENYKNLIFHQIIDGKGTLNYCVRWQSTKTLDAATRKNTVTLLNTMINTWVKELAGFENWPYPTVTVKVVGWAADDASKFPDPSSDEKIFTAYTESDGSNPTLPRCPDACARPLHFAESGYNYSSCEIGERFDMSLWMTDGFYGGAGGDWGQRGSTDNFLSYVASPNNFSHIIGHEAGHGFGLPDFYETYQVPDANYSALPCTDYSACGSSNYGGSFDMLEPLVMWAGSSAVVTDYDAWLLRMVWHNIKSQFGY